VEKCQFKHLPVFYDRAVIIKTNTLSNSLSYTSAPIFSYKQLQKVTGDQ